MLRHQPRTLEQRVAKLTFHGEPYVVDIVLRPVLSGARWLIGVGLGVLLFWLDFVLWAPIPVLVTTALMEAWLALRSDRPVRVVVDGERLVVDDRFAPTLTIFRDRVHALTVLHQPRSHGGADGHELVMVLCSERRIEMALAAQVTTLPPLRGGAIDVARQDRRLGAQAGLLRAMAPLGRSCRQRIHDPALLEAVWAWTPPEARSRQALRLWRGPEPELSPFGLHTEEPHGVLVLHEDHWSLLDGDDRQQRGPRRCARAMLAERHAILFGVDGTEDATSGVLPLWMLVLPSDDGEELIVAVPAPTHAGTELPTCGSHALHTHAPEGAVLIAWLDEVGQLPASTDRGPSRMDTDTPSAAPGEPRR